MHHHLFGILLAGAGLFISSSVWAIGNYSPADLSDLTNQSVESLLKTVAIGADHKAYMPASPMGYVIGLDVGVEATIIKLPTEFIDAMNMAIDESSFPAILVLPRLNIHKGLPGGIDLGFSYVTYQSNTVWGLGAQWAFFQGSAALPVLAIRGSANFLSIFFMKTQTYKFDLVASKPLSSFFEPYIGAGLQIASGELRIDAAATNFPADISAKASKVAPHFFIGLPMKLFFLKITGEYDYSTAGISTYGAKVSFSF